MRTYLSAMVLALTGLQAFAAENTDLYICRSNSPVLARYLFKGADEATFKNIKALTVKIGQDQTPTAPLYEAKMEGFDQSGLRIAGPLVFKRIALAKSPTSDAVSISYSPSSTAGDQNAAAFNLLIPESMNAQISFVQINNAGAPYSPTAMACENLSLDLKAPESVDLNGKSEEEQIAIIRTMLRLLPTSRNWADEDEFKVPSDVVKNAKELAAEYMEKMDVTEEDVIRELRLKPNEERTYAIAIEANRCPSTKFTTIRPARDMTGKTFAYDASFECKALAVTVTTTFKNEKTKPYIRKYSMSIDHAYLTPSQGLFSQSKMEFTGFDEEE